jgi:RNA polymerase sigma-70 factor (ECF subfamily)
VTGNKRHANGSAIAFCERIEASSEQLEDLDTARLVIGIQSGDRNAFAGLYRRYFDRVFSYLRLLLNDSHQAEDATQDVFIKLMEKIPAYERQREPFRAWLFTVARNQAIDRLRRSHRLELDQNGELERQSTQAAVEPPQLSGFDWISDADLMLFVERLPIAQRQVLALRFMLDMSHREIAAVLSRSEVDVRTLQHRALRYLENRLGAIRGRPAGRRRARSQIYRRQAPVLRMRRFSLSP